VRKAKVLYIDMDDVIADFYKAAYNPVTKKIDEELMFKKDFFLDLEPVPGAKSAVFQLMKMGFDVWILSQPFALDPSSYIQKAEWIGLHFPQLYNKIILTQDKGLNVGDYLIDDNKKKWQDKFEQNGGKFVHFPYGGYNMPNFGDPEGTWDYIVKYFKTEDPLKD